MLFITYQFSIDRKTTYSEQVKQLKLALENQKQQNRMEEVVDPKNFKNKINFLILKSYKTKNIERLFFI